MTVGAIRARAPCPNTIWRTSEAMLTKEKPTRAYCSSRSSPRPLARWIPGAMHTTWARKMVAGVQAAEQVVEDWGVTYIVLSRGQERTCAMDDLDQCTRTAAICMFSARLSLRAVSPVLTLSEGHTAARIGAADVDNTTQRMMHRVLLCTPKVYIHLERPNFNGKSVFVAPIQSWRLPFQDQPLLLYCCACGLRGSVRVFSEARSTAHYLNYQGLASPSRRDSAA